jgi:protein tyrosine/serine phosphatase
MRFFLILFYLILASFTSPAAQRGLPAQEGILNFGKVNDNLFRGAQPDAAAIKRLNELGVKTIIDLRTSGKAVKAEATTAAEHGILCTNIPLNGTRAPTDREVQKVLAAIESFPGPVFIHCQHGCDRTGTIVACYRIKHDGWSGEKALYEALKYGLSSLEPGMRRYILEFGKAGKASKPD